MGHSLLPYLANIPSLSPPLLPCPATFLTSLQRLLQAEHLITLLSGVEEALVKQYLHLQPKENITQCSEDVSTQGGRERPHLSRLPVTLSSRHDISIDHHVLSKMEMEGKKK